MVNKKDAIENLVKLLSHDDIEFRTSTMENETVELYGNPYRYIENVPTGYKIISIQVLNRKQHMEYIEKLHNYQR